MTALITSLADGRDPLPEGLEALGKISLSLGARLGIDLLAMLLLIGVVYFKAYRSRELFFTYYIFNLVIFLICFLLNKVDLSMGAAFGLFAVFSMLRYRTEDISIRDMSYLFLAIAMGLINAVTKIREAEPGYEYLFLLLINGAIILITFLLESSVFFKKEHVQLIMYDDMELLKAGNEALLLEDLKKRTGIGAHRVSVGRIDLLKSAAQIKVYYYKEN